MTKPTVETKNKLELYKSELNEIINKRTQFLIHRLRQEQFYHSNKSGKYLANQIKRNKEKNYDNSNTGLSREAYLFTN